MIEVKSEVSWGVAHKVIGVKSIRNFCKRPLDAGHKIRSSWELYITSENYEHVTVRSYRSVICKKYCLGVFRDCSHRWRYLIDCWQRRPNWSNEDVISRSVGAKISRDLKVAESKACISGPVWCSNIFHIKVDRCTGIRSLDRNIWQWIFPTMIGAIDRFIRLQYYRYSTVTGLYIMGNIESTIIQITFFIVLYFLVRYTCTFFTQLSNSGLQNVQH